MSWYNSVHLFTQTASQATLPSRPVPPLQSQEDFLLKMIKDEFDEILETFDGNLRTLSTTVAEQTDGIVDAAYYILNACAKAGYTVSVPFTLSKPKTSKPTSLEKREVEQALLFIQVSFEKQPDFSGKVKRSLYMLGELANKANLPTAEIFEAVQAANMRKFPDGKAIFREDGKVLKPEGWVGPDLEIQEICEGLCKH